jgi:hypothetical protein
MCCDYPEGALWCVIAEAVRFNDAGKNRQACDSAS